MLTDHMTGELLFNDPLILSKCLDDISNDIEIPYFQKREGDFLNYCENFDQDIVQQIIKQESQLKLLVDFIEILIDRSQEKMQQQHETIDKLEQELKEVRDEKQSVKFELSIIKQNFELLQDKYKSMQTAFIELEENYDRERLASNAKKLEVHVLSTIKEKYAEAKDEERRKTIINMKLSEEKEAIEAQCTIAKEECQRLRERIALKEIEMNSFNQIIEENAKLKVQVERLSKDFEFERESLNHEINYLRESLDNLNHQYQKLEQELKDELSKNLAPPLKEIPEDNNNNMNIRMSRVTFPQRIGRGSISSDPYSPAGSLGCKSSQFFRSFMGGEENGNGIEQYEAMRFSLSREGSLSRRASYVKDPNLHEEPIMTMRIEEECPVKEDRACQISFDSLMSTETTLKLEPASNTSLHTLETSATNPAPQDPTSQNAQLCHKKSHVQEGKRKDVLEEFYSLTWQSALMNSPNFNSLAGKVDSSAVYDELSNLGIPFFKWYNWIEEKLKELYQDQVLPEIRERRQTSTQIKNTA